MFCFVTPLRALACSCSTKEENSVRFGIGRAERAIDNALGVNAATGHFAQMDGIIDRWDGRREISSMSINTNTSLRH